MDQTYSLYNVFTDTTESFGITGLPGFQFGGGDQFLTDTQLTIISVTAALLATFILTSNFLVIASILRPRNRDRLLTPTNILIAQLSVADFFVGGLTVPFFVLQYYGLPHSYVGCVLTMGVSSMVPTVASYCGCLFLSIERYLSIQHPYLWERVVNTRTVAIASVGIWTFAVSYNLSIFGYNKGWNPMNICVFYLLMKTEFLVYVSFLACQVFPLIVMVYMYSRIFVTARRHLLKVVPGGQGQTASGSDAKVSLRKQIRIAQKCFIIVIVIILCLLPSGVANTISLYFGVQNTYVQVAFAVLIFVNSAINPFLYAQSNAKLKSEMLKLMCFWKNPELFDNSVNTLTQTAGSAN